MPSDPFGAADLRRTVLAAWEASPARFREDANAEDELVRGGYRDRVVVELVQNAADAAAAAGSPGHVLLALEGDRLTVANTGADLDASGVAGLSSLRASTKRDSATVGRFGVGFAAVLTVTDEPSVLTRRGGVTWSRGRARDAAATVVSLADELARRGDAVPVLRLPFAVTDAPGPPEGYDTAVVLPLRDDAAVQLVRGLLADVDDALMLAFPGLAELRVEVDGAARVLAAGPAEPVTETAGAAVGIRQVNERRWTVAERAGVLDPALLADRPHEERDRRRWSVLVALPDDGATGAEVIHAPTPTDDRTDLPVLVIATFPLDSSRRRVAPGPLTDHLVGEVGAAYADLLVAVGRPDVLDLVPMPLGAGDLDTAVHRTVVDVLGRTPLVPSARGDAVLRPRDVVVVDRLDGRSADTVLGDIVEGLPAREWWRPDVLRRLGATVRPLADVVDDLASVALAATDWRRMYDALAVEPVPVGELGALPVPLVDGRLVRGARGVIVPADVDPASLIPLGLRVVEPDAAHPLLRRLGAVDATPATILRDPAVRAAVENAGHDRPEEVQDLAASVLRLVAASAVDVTEEPWLASLPVDTAAGDLAPVGELWLAGAPVVPLLDIDPDADVVAAHVVDHHGRELLVAVGATDGFRIVRDHDVTADDDLWHDLDAEDDYAAFVRDRLPETGVPPVIAEYVAVADLDLVRQQAWPDALAHLAADPATRAALVDPATVLDGTGNTVRLPSYTAWWLRTHARILGHPPTELSAGDADPQVRILFPPAPTGLDDAVAAALGFVRELDDCAPSVVLQRLADDSLRVGATDLAVLYAWLASVDPEGVTPPDRIRVPDGAGSRVVDAGDVVVADGPHWLAVVDGRGAVLPGTSALAYLLDVASASEEIDAVVPDGRAAPVPQVVTAVLPGAPEQYMEHDELVVAGVDVGWWLDAAGTVHAATSDGLAAGLAWAAGRWDRRWLVAAVLADPSSVDRLVAEDTFTSPSAS